MIEVHLVRHGVRWDSEDPTWRQTAVRPKDTPLSESGIRQATEVGKFLREKEIVEISASPYLRTLQTAEHISKALHKPQKFHIEEGIREWVRNKLDEPVYIPLQDAIEQFSLLDSEYVSLFQCPTAIETPEQIHKRCRDFLQFYTERLVNLQQTTPKVSVVLVSHAATVIALIRAFLNDETFSVKIGTCSITSFQLDTTNDSSTWKMKCCADTTHLSEGTQCAWGFKDS